MRRPALCCALAASLLGGALATQETPFEETREPTARTAIDALLFAEWKQRNLTPARPCSDAVFVRRVHLDTIGTLPSVDEVTAFLSDPSSDKRRQLIDRLLLRPEFADYWALKWSDLLRVKSEFPINLWPNAAQAYHRWIRTCIAEAVPLDRFAKELLTASGSNFRVPQVNFYRAMQDRSPETIARTVALTFLAQRTERWPKERLAGLAGFFGQVGFKTTGEWKEEIVLFDPEKPAGAAVFPDGARAAIAPGRDPREVFAEWLLAPENPSFAPGLANRMWSWLMGRGLVHEPDDFRPDNPASQPRLLALLAKQLVACGYDQRKLFRTILDSAVYQLSALPREQGQEVAALFAAYPLRRLEAEVLIDAIDKICGTSESYTSAIPEPFTVVPPGVRSITLWDGSITSSFLELFGRSPRDTGLESERGDRCTAGQRLHLLNSSHIQRKLEQGSRLRALFESRRPPKEILTNLYLTILSRPPTASELAIAQTHVQARAEGGFQARRSAAIDVAWALINSAEFQFRH